MKSAFFIIRLLKFVVFSGLTGLAFSTHAHDFWMQASPYYPQPGDRVNISIHVGMDMVGDSLPNISDWYRDFSYFDGETRRRVKGSIGDVPAGHFKAKSSGTHVIGYHSKPDFVELKPDKFNDYLREEGLEKIIARREALDESENNAREHYIRCSKMLVQSGDNHEGHDYSFGYPLELYPLKNPYALKAGGQLPVQLRYNDQPLESALIIAFTRQQPDKKQKIRTDTEGKAVINLDRKGTWIIKTVEMKRSSKKDAEWVSHWASLTFQLGRPSAPQRFFVQKDDG